MTACKERHGVRTGLQTLIAVTCCAGDNFHVKDGDQSYLGGGAKGSLVLVFRRIGATLLPPTRMILFYAGGQSHTQPTNRHTQKHIHACARARAHTHTRTHAGTHAQTHKLHTHTHTHTSVHTSCALIMATRPRGQQQQIVVNMAKPMLSGTVLITVPWVTG